MIARRLARPTAATVGLLVAILFAGCAGTKKRYEKGLELERLQRYHEASNYYIAVLEKDADFADARVRLADVGARAISNDFRAARDHSFNGDHLAAHETLVRAEVLSARAGQVGVPLDLPDQFGNLKADSERRVVTQLERLADEAERQGRWAEAAAALERARNWPTVAPGKRVALDEHRAVVLLAWGREELGAGHYRAAYERTLRVLELLSPQHATAVAAFEVQAEALERGTLFTAFLPVAQTDEVSRVAPRLLYEDLNDVLLYDHWSVPPPFIAMADPIVVRRELRRIVGRGSRVVALRDAVEIGRVVDADYVVGSEVTEYAYDERSVKESVQKAKTRGRGAVDTTYTLKEYTRHLEGKIEYRIYGIRGRDVVDQGSLTTSVSERMRRALYAGDYRDLDLSSQEVSLFDPREIELQDQEVEERLADELAAKLAERVYQRLLRMVP